MIPLRQMKRLSRALMKETIHLETKRLKLRQWKDTDLPIFSEMNADPSVMEYYPSILSEDESIAMANKLKELIYERSWGFWAVETKEKNEFIGFVGLHKPTYDLPVTPCVEIGWRLGKQHWGKGYATEAANEVLKFAFEVLKLNEVYSFTSVINKASWSVMQRVGMQNLDKNFYHPIVDQESILSEHVLYKITEKQWGVKV